MITINKKTDCCGCTACSAVCAHNAIKMQSDKFGFIYPVVDVDRCIECGLCEKVCQFHNDYKRYNNFEEPLVFALRHKEQSQLMRSQSGGAFFGIAQYILNSGGVIYGAAFSDEWKVKHLKAVNTDQLEELRMSKYVQSDMRGVFIKIRNDLKQGNKVLFSGTPCQVAGLKSFLSHKLHENLFCVDIVCHGVPSPKIWEDYIHYLEKHYKSKIIKACFRDKRFGWHGAKETFKFKNGNEIMRETSNRLYFQGLSMRESCSQCKYTNFKRVGDISVGDFWGIPKDSPYEKDGKGLSLLLVNSEKGYRLFKSVKDKFIVEQSSLTECMQPQLQYPSKLSPLHKKFVKDYEDKGFLYIAKKYGDIGWRFYVRNTKSKFRILICKIISAFHINNRFKE